MSYLRCNTLFVLHFVFVENIYILVCCIYGIKFEVIDLELYKIGRKYKLFLKPEYNQGRNIYYLATILGREGNKLIINKDGIEKQLDIDVISESELVGDFDGKGYN